MSDKQRAFNRVSRREFLRTMAIVSSGAALAACAAPAGPPAEQPTSPPGEPYGGPLGVEKGTIELQIRESGTQRAPALEQIVEALQPMYPETEWNLVYDMQNWDVLRPRFIAGDPPDGSWLSVSGDPWGLLDEDLLMDLTPLMEVSAYGEEGVQFKDLYLPGMLEPGQKDGKQYLLPFSTNTWGLWHSRSLLEENGWSVPAELGAWEWDDFTAMMRDIKDAGYSAILSGGPGNAGSFWSGFAVNFIYQTGGDQQFADMNSLIPGAWNNEAMVAALDRFQELYREEYIDPLWSSIQWTDADTLLVQQKAVFKPDGQWFPSQHREDMPEGFELGFAPTPIIPELEGSSKLIQANAEPAYFVPKDAQHPRGGMEFIRLWVSKPFSNVFAEVGGDIIPIQGGGEGADWNSASAHMLTYFRAAERYYNPMWHVWYKGLTLKDPVSVNHGFG